MRYWRGFIVKDVKETECLAKGGRVEEGWMTNCKGEEDQAKGCWVVGCGDGLLTSGCSSSIERCFSSPS